MKSIAQISHLPGRLTMVSCALFLLLASLVLWQANETNAGTVAPAWQTYAQNQATARYWLDDDLGPAGASPQEVDEQEHVY